MVLDILCVICILTAFYFGFSRGIISTFFSIVSVVFGVIAAVRFGPHLSKGLQDLSGSDHAAWFFAGFLLAFIIILVGMRMFASFLENILESVNINFINQTLGGLITAAFFMLLYSVTVKFFDSARLITDKTKKESIVFPYVQVYPSYAYDVGMKAKPALEKFWVQTLDVMDEIEERSEGRTSSNTPQIYDIEEEEDNGIIYDEELDEK